MRGPLSSAILALFSAVVVAALVYLFYASALRERVECKLYDIRTRLAPDIVSTERVAVVGIDQAAIRALDGLEAKSPASHAKEGEKDKEPDLSYKGLLQVIKAALSTRARTVAVLLPSQVYSHQDPHLADVAALAQNDPRLLLGTFDVSSKGQGLDMLPRAFEPVIGQVVRADLTREFRRGIIREVTLHEARELPYLAGQVLKLSDPRRYAVLVEHPGGSKTTVELNYIRPQHLQQVRADVLVQAPQAANLDGKVVLIGYTTYRPFTSVAREATFANTPWQAEGDDMSEGTPVVILHAIALVNLLEGDWLSPAPLGIDVAQTVFLTLLVLATWQLSIGFATLLFIGGWSLILIVHALMFSFLKVHVPLTDAFLWSALATVTGAFLRVRVEGQLRAEEEARFQADKELAETQDRFLDRFAVELAALNGKVGSLLQDMAPLIPEVGTTQVAYDKARGSAAELGDYLAGIRQFTAIRDKRMTAPPLTPVDGAQVVGSVLDQFEARKVEARVTFVVDLKAGCRVLGERTIMAQIVYNLVSNAVKYAPPGTTIWITSKKQGDYLVLTVRDEGPGIAPEFHDRIFEKFYRVKDDMVYKHKGHGLGLYLSRFFAAQIGASITVTSTPGQGAEFHLTLQDAAGRQS